MTNQATYPASAEIISSFEVLFAKRTGVTVLVPKVAAFDDGDKMKISFKVSPDHPEDVIIDANNKPVILKGLQKPHVEAAVAQGFIMFYETKDDEVIRCTPCGYKGN